MAKNKYKKGAVHASAAGTLFVILLASLHLAFTPAVEQHQFSFYRAEYVHPKIIDALHGDFGDLYTSIVEIDLLVGNDSNQFYGEVYTETRDNGDLWVMSRGTSDIHAEEAYCGYHYIGTSVSGTHILEVVHCPGGTSVMESLVLVTINHDDVIELGFEDSPGKRSRVLLAHKGTIAIRNTPKRKVSFHNGILEVEYSNENWDRNAIVPVSIGIE